MYMNLSEEFNDFEISAQAYAEMFFFENIDLIEFKSGVKRKMFNAEKLTKLYVIYEYFMYRAEKGKPLNESGFYDVLKSANKKEYIDVMCDYCNKCGRICSIRNSYDMACNMAKYIKSDIVDGSLSLNPTDYLIVKE